LEAVVETPQQPAQAVPDAPAESSVEQSTQPEQQTGTEGTEKKAETEETPQKRESRRQRQLNRERERRIAAETELRLLRESQQRQPATPQQADGVDHDAPQRGQFENYEDFIRAEAKYYARKEAREEAKRELAESRKSEQRQRTQSQQQEVSSKFDSHYQKAADGIDDFDDVMSDEESVELLSKVFGTDKPITVQAIHEADEKGPLILYYLAKNPGEVERISKLSPARQAAAIVALEDKVAKPAKKPSKAPAPINPVGTKVEVGKDPAKMTQAEYNEWRRNGGK
jgi:hypothetical protein